MIFKRAATPRPSCRSTAPLSLFSRPQAAWPGPALLIDAHGQRRGTALAIPTVASRATTRSRQEYADAHVLIPDAHRPVGHRPRRLQRRLTAADNGGGQAGRHR
ncbi:hypothetical protein BRN29_08175, partial [Xanthomonas oryzae pv. oryzae]